MLLIPLASALCVSPPSTMVPPSGTVGAPLDTVPYWTGPALEVPMLLGPDGSEVPATRTSIVSGGEEMTTAILPTTLLEPGATYTVIGETDTYTFTTEDRLADAPDVPVAPTVDVTLDESDGDCDGVTAWVEDAVEARVAISVATPPAGHLEALVRVGDTPEFTVVGSGSVVLSRGGCHRSNVPSLKEEASIEVAIRAVNEAGVPSAWTEWRGVELPWPEPCPDAVEPACGGGPGLFAVPLLLLTRRARRETRRVSG